MTIGSRKGVEGLSRCKITKQSIVKCHQESDDQPTVDDFREHFIIIYYQLIDNRQGNYSVILFSNLFVFVNPRSNTN